MHKLDESFDQVAATQKVRDTIAANDKPGPNIETARAIAAYVAYGTATGGKNWQGLPMPSWSDLPEKIQDAWRAAANAAQRVS